MAIAERELKTKDAEILSAPEETDDEWTLEEYLEALDVELPPQPLSFEEFMEWGLKVEIHAEWVEGYIEVRMGTDYRHQDIILMLSMMFSFWSGKNGGKALLAPFTMRLNPGVKIKKANRQGSGREPDVLYLAPENMGRLQPTFIDGPADVAVEVISPESQQRDRYVKFSEYEKAGVREYWLIDWEAQEEEFYRRDDATGRFVRVALTADNIFRSEVMPGLLLDVTVLRQRPLPTADVILRSAGLM